MTDSRSVLIVLICSSLMTCDVGHLSCAYLPSVYLLLPILKLGCLFYYCGVLRVFYIFWIKSFVKCLICKYFLPICGLSFHSLNSIFQRAEVQNFDEVQFINVIFYGSCLDSIFKNSVPSSKSQRFSCVFF